MPNVNIICISIVINTLFDGFLRCLDKRSGVPENVMLKRIVRLIFFSFQHFLFKKTTEWSKLYCKGI